jgi:CSLREA domain-containing protein
MIRRGSLALFFVVSVALPLRAADFVVTRYDDPAPDGCQATDCSLREAVIAANAQPDFDVIHLSAGVYDLTRPGANENAAATGDLDLLHPARIVGPGASLTAIDGHGLDRLIETRADSDPEVSELVGVTLRGGGNDFTASALLVGSDLVVTGCEVRENGDADHFAGAITLLPAAGLTLSASTVAETVGIGCDLRGDATLENVTASDNSEGELKVTSGADVACRHCTLRQTNPSFSVILSKDGLTVVHLVNSIVVGICAANSGGQIASSGGNLESPGDTCGLVQGDDEPNVSTPELLLGSLDNHGGTTRTYRPLATSHAIDTARDAECLAADQRGSARPGTGCDRGTVEVGSPPPFTPIFVDGFEQGSVGAWAAAVGG